MLFNFFAGTNLTFLLNDEYDKDQVLYSWKNFINGFGPILYMKLFIDVMNMLANCTYRNAKLIKDLFVIFARDFC